MTTIPFAPRVDDHVVEPYRRTLVAGLKASGDLIDPAWEAAVSRVPRHVFLPRFYDQPAPRTGLWKPVDPVIVGQQAWLEHVYTDATWVTQFDGHDSWTGEPAGPAASPTSSSTLPGLLVRMFEHLDVRDGHRLLVVGTGTGYSTALACERLGAGRVVSVDVDPVLTERARARLGAAGYSPTVVSGDGADGWADAAPYDRVIAFCAFTSVPAAWVSQCHPGAVVVTTITGGLGGFGLVKLTVRDDGTAQGHVLPDHASFMTARAQATPRPTDLKTRQGKPTGPSRPVRVTPDVLRDRSFRFAAQLALPDVITFDVQDSDGARSTYIQHVRGDSWARVQRIEEATAVTQGGERRLWDELERAYDGWRWAGSPKLERHRVSVTSAGQIISLDDHD